MNNTGFHNTVGLQGELLFEAENGTKKQQERVMAVFRRYPDREFTPAEIHLIIDDYKTLLTSVRRAICNATKDGLLIKTGNKKPGLYNVPNLCWKLNQNS